MLTLLVDVGWHVDRALIDVDADVVEMFVVLEQKLGCIQSLRHRIADLLRTEQQRQGIVGYRSTTDVKNTDLRFKKTLENTFYLYLKT